MTTRRDSAARAAARRCAPVVLTCVFLLTLAARASEPPAGAGAAGADPLAALAARLDDFVVEGVQPVAGEAGSLQAVVQIDGQPRELVLYPYSLRAADFQVLLAAGGRFERLTGAALPAPRTFRGVVRDVPGSGIAATVQEDGRLTALVELNGQRWQIEPLANFVGGAAPDAHVVYRLADVRPEAGICGLAGSGPAAGAGEPGVLLGGPALRMADIAIDIDFPYFQQLLQSVQLVLIDVELIMNQVDFIYHNDTDIRYEITTVVIRTSAADDPYTSSSPGTLLDQFAFQWNFDSDLIGARRDVAQLWTGRDISGASGGVIGIANPSSVCDLNDAYSLNETRDPGTIAGRVALVAHELGHNWSAQHCDELGCACNIMCSTLGGCCGFGNPNFSAFAISQITTFKSGLTCLSPVPDPLTPPFFDNFESASLDFARWPYNDGGVISTAATGEPSGTRSLNLDSVSGAQYGADDEVRTNVINLAGVPAATVSYYTQHKGVEAGEQLFVEFVNANGLWTELNVITSDGADQTAFEFFSHPLPASALHAEFRLRFRVDGNATNDDWYIDDVRVEVPAGCAGDADGDGQVGPSDLGLLLGAWGACAGGAGFDAAADLDADGCVGPADLGLLLGDWGCGS